MTAGPRDPGPPAPEFGRILGAQNPLPTGGGVPPPRREPGCAVPRRSSVRVEDSDGAARFLLTGRFDTEAIYPLYGAIGRAMYRDVVLDLDEVTFIDGVAWMTLMAFERRVRDWGSDFRVANARGHLRKVFELTETEYLLSEVAGR